MVAQNTISITRRFSSRSKWSEVAKVLAAGNDGYLSVGDVITDKLKNGETFSVEVVALNPYAENTAVFVFKDIPERYVMNDDATNRGGWRDCKMRRHLRDEFFALLPDDLQAVIKERTIKQKLNGNIVTTQDKLWIMSHVEIFGGTYETDIDDVQFEWFKDRRNRIKFFNGEPYYWWGRSPRYGSAARFCFVGTSGNADYYNAYYSYGVAPAFII